MGGIRVGWILIGSVEAAGARPSHPYRRVRHRHAHARAVRVHVGYARVKDEARALVRQALTDLDSGDSTLTGSTARVRHSRNRDNYRLRMLLIGGSLTDPRIS